MANDSPLDDSDADYSDSNLVHSADNPRAAVLVTTHRFTDEHYDKCSTRGDGDGGACVSSEAEARIPSIQFVNYSTVQ
jgi:hypothetical protein